MWAAVATSWCSGKWLPLSPSSYSLLTSQSLFRTAEETDVHTDTRNGISFTTYGMRRAKLRSWNPALKWSSSGYCYLHARARTAASNHAGSETGNIYLHSESHVIRWSLLNSLPRHKLLVAFTSPKSHQAPASCLQNGEHWILCNNLGLRSQISEHVWSAQMLW